MCIVRLCCRISSPFTSQRNGDEVLVPGKLILLHVLVIC